MRPWYALATYEDPKPYRRRFAVVLLLASLTGGCGYVLKGAGEYPGYVECRGKGSVTGVGQTSLSAGLGGAGQNSFTLTVDCGDGLIYQQGKEPPASAGSVVPPSLPPKTP
ncbi:MAG: hypothetical protein E6J01_03830 [Chloroflexi bacterium]|nr:MAG: hypothetical protein E6J01_03830 [Chloroflexota bacterium]